jgi:predicted RNA-binding protein with PIN domain
MAAATSQSLLLVDGYNIIGAWSYLKKTCDRNGLEAARQELVEVLINYTAHEGLITQIVFDSHYQKTPGSQEEYTPSLSVYYTAFAQTADTYIEKLCASYQRKERISVSRLIVATSDQAQRLTAIGYGAEWMSAQRLGTEVEVTAHQIRRKHRPKKQTQGRFLFNSLDPQAQQLLAQWRRGIY